MNMPSPQKSRENVKVMDLVSSIYGVVSLLFRERDKYLFFFFWSPSLVFLFLFFFHCDPLRIMKDELERKRSDTTNKAK